MGGVLDGLSLSGSAPEFIWRAEGEPDKLPDGKILDWSKLKQFEDDILKCI